MATKKFIRSKMWFVENIEQVLSEFKQREIELADDLRIHPYGLKEFAFVDVNGYFVRVAEPLKKE
jgi:hypothetical protein